MKPEVLQSLMTGKVLLNQSRELCFTEDSYAASSGLVILQDALELIFISLLIEKGVDEQKAIESFSFDQIVGELKKVGLKVIKSGTLKALNKQRVVVKHYGQTSDSSSVANYFDVACQAVDSLLLEVVGKRLDEIMLCEMLADGEAKQYLQEASLAIEQAKYFKALVNIRKAIFVEIEADYCIYSYRQGGTPRGLGLLAAAGMKAPYFTKNATWIEDNVKDPFDYIQLDHGKIRQDLIEWGASTQDFFNIWRLTPEVIRLEQDSDWLLKGELKHLYQAATRENAIFCLDRAINLLGKKQQHQDNARWLDFSAAHRLNVKISSATSVFRKASKNADVVARLGIGDIYEAQAIVPSLDGEHDRFAQILHIQDDEPRFLSGYVDLEDCELVEPPEPTNQ
ncbi:hypothetical protein KBTX_02674 [wastewater metagenome]|uniref:Uncharacterized protein n=3 Tax=root TaxID=1 RepID=A0A5B8RFM1_9ZZZZ|nr:hypothetical protein KBTEX_02674 [uncultured organism]